MACSKHPKYSGFRLGKKAQECPDCVSFHQEKRNSGVVEKRKTGVRKTVNVVENVPVVTAEEAK